eukprot:762009-Hanusia_phi.AAC.1
MCNRGIRTGLGSPSKRGHVVAREHAWLPVTRKSTRGRMIASTVTCRSAVCCRPSDRTARPAN